MDKKAQKYFYFHMKRLIANENKILAYKYQVSIREILQGYIENFIIFKSKESKKTFGSFDSYINIIKNAVKESSLKKIPELEKEFKHFSEVLTKLTNLIEEVKKSETTEITNSKKGELKKNYEILYKLTVVFKKKLDVTNIYSFFIKRALEENNFEKIEIIAMELFNELIYDGYSLQYLKKFVFDITEGNSITPDNIEGLLYRFNELYKEKEDFSLYIYLFNENKFIEKENLQYLEKLEEEKIPTFFNGIPKKKFYDLFLFKTSGLDVYKVAETIYEKINNYFYLKKLSHKIAKDICLNEYFYNTSSEFIKGFFNKNDHKILFSILNKKEESDLNDFLEYRRKMKSFSFYNEEIHVLQRILNITKSFEKVSKENKLLNQWSSLEAMLMYANNTSFDKIVPKINHILPKIIVLYSIKDKLNTFWHILLSLKSDFSIELKDMLKNDSTPLKYDLKKITTIIPNLDKENPGLFNKIQENDILLRELSTIGMLLSKKNSRKNFFEKIENAIKADISYIYRTRNLLVHSGMYPETNFDFKTLRLNDYNNRLLGVIIHYKKNNINITIEEIFNSLELTYKLYSEAIEKDDINLEYLCKPNYLFL